MTFRDSGLRSSLIAAVCLLAVLATAQQAVTHASTITNSTVPRIVNYSGTLTDLNGKPLTEITGVTFLLYKDAQGGAPLWIETQNVQPSKTGHYTVTLGSTTSQGLPADVFVSGEARWLGVKVDGQEEQQRVLLVAVPYALKAHDAETIGGLPPSAFLLAPTGVSAGTIATAGTTANSQLAPAGTTPVTTAGGTAKALAKFDTASDIASSQIFDTGTNVGIGTTTPTAKLDVNGASNFRGAVTLQAGLSELAAKQPKSSEPLNFVTSGINSSTKKVVNSTFTLLAESAGNNTPNPSGTLHLLFGSGNNVVSDTGLSISSKGILTFAPGQTFPGGGGSGTVTSVGLSAPISDFAVSGSPVTKSGTLNLQWLVAPTSSNNANAIVKRDNSGNFNANVISAFGILLNEGGVGSVMSSNFPNTSAISGKSFAAGDGTTRGVSGVSSTNQGAGTFGLSQGTGGAGVLGQNNLSGFGVLGQALGTSGQGVWGEAFGTQPNLANGFQPDGVDGITHNTAGSGVVGINTAAGDGVFGQAPSPGLAGQFFGDVEVSGNLSKSGGSFKIDHPLDPANKYLYHSFVESSDMMNVYNGNIVTDGQGRAVVQMPEWFEALNRDFRYQLTVVGQFAQVIIATKMANNSFTIKTDKPNVEVSWQVTGIRQDAWANAHRIPVEESKKDGERGLYLHPELFDAPEEKSVVVAHHPGIVKMMKTSKAQDKKP